MSVIICEFATGASYRFTWTEDKFSLSPGEWVAPFEPSRDSNIGLGLMEMWRQNPHDPMYALIEHHGEPVKITVIEETDEAVYRFRWDCGRMGSLEGVFVSTKALVESAIGRCVYFGEVLGKHSEISGTLTDKDIRVLTTDPQIISVFKANRMTTGFNPLDYIDEDEYYRG